MLVDLKLGEGYDGFLFLAEAVRNPPILESHHHLELELNLVTQGTINYVMRGKRFTFQAGTLLWMFPSQEHQLVDRSDDARYYVAVFKRSLIERACRTPAYAGLKRAGRGLDTVVHAQLDPESFDLVRKVMETMMRGSLDPNLLNREAGYGNNSSFSFQHGDPDGLNAGLHYLLLLAWRGQLNGRVLEHAVALHPSVRRALAILSEDDHGMSLAGLAKKCGVSAAYLSRTFHHELGVTLTRFRNTLRLSRFWREFHQDERKTLAEAVYAAGFGSYAQFYKVYVQNYGSGPRASGAGLPPPETPRRALNHS